MIRCSLYCSRIGAVSASTQSRLSRRFHDVPPRFESQIVRVLTVNLSLLCILVIFGACHSPDVAGAFRCAEFVSEYCEQDAAHSSCDLAEFEREDCSWSLWEGICREEDRAPMADPATCIEDLRNRSCERFADDPATFWDHVPLSCDPVFGTPPRP